MPSLVSTTQTATGSTLARLALQPAPPGRPHLSLARRSRFLARWTGRSALRRQPRLHAPCTGAQILCLPTRKPAQTTRTASTNTLGRLACQLALPVSAPRRVLRLLFSRATLMVLGMQLGRRLAQPPRVQMVLPPHLTKPGLTTPPAKRRTLAACVPTPAMVEARTTRSTLATPARASPWSALPQF